MVGNFQVSITEKLLATYLRIISYIVQDFEIFFQNCDQQGCTNYGICIGIRPIPAYFDGIRIIQVCYTSTNFIVCVLYIFMKYVVFQSFQVKM